MANDRINAEVFSHAEILEMLKHILNKIAKVEFKMNSSLIKRKERDAAWKYIQEQLLDQGKFQIQLKINKLLKFDKVEVSRFQNGGCLREQMGFFFIFLSWSIILSLTLTSD